MESTFGQLVRTRHWNNYQGFLVQFHRTARMVADRDCDPRLATLTVSEKTFKRWRSGQVRTQPRPDVARVLEALFEQPADCLFRPHAAGVSESSMVTDAHHGTETQIRMAAERALKFSALILGDELSSDVIQHLQAEAAHLSAATTRDPLPVLITGLANLQDISISLLHRQHRPDQLRDLYMIAALASGLMAKASLDAGDRKSAMTQARTGLLCAQRAGHTGLAETIISWQALFAYWAGQPHQTVRYSQQAASLGAKGYVSIFAPAMEARAHAVIGDREATVSAIARVREVADQYQATELDGFGGIFVFAGYHQARFTSEAQILLDPSSHAAATAADEAVAVMAATPPDDRYFVNDANTNTFQAITRVAGGHLDAAQQSLAPVFELPADRLNHTTMLSLMRVHSHLRTRASQSPGLARDLREQIEQFTGVGPRSPIR